MARSVARHAIHADSGVGDPSGASMSTANDLHPPLPPFTRETAIQKVRMGEDGWNSRNPEKVALAYSEQSRWRNRAEFIVGREQIVAFLRRKWNHEHEYRLIKELWTYADN